MVKVSGVWKSKSWNILTFLIIVPLLNAFLFSSFQRCHHCINNFNKHAYFSKLYMGTTVAPADAQVLPAVYETDLYSVLGVPSNSSKSELKEAYMKIVFRSHPDRNNTAEALSLFRNATYAYQILGKDDKTRALYDRKINTQVYLNALEDVGNDIIKPLAMEVAVPLLNLTVRSIGSVAIPFLRDMFDYSAAVVKATMAGDETDSFDDMVSRAMTAFEKTSYDQNMKKLMIQLRRFDEILNKSYVELETANMSEQGALKETIELKEKIISISDSKSILDREEIEIRSLYEEAKVAENRINEQFQSQSILLSETLIQANQAMTDLVIYEEEIIRLENLLNMARLQAQACKKDIQKYNTMIRMKKTLTQGLERSFNSAKYSFNEKEKSLKNITENKIRLDNRLSFLNDEYITWNSTLKREMDYKGTLIKKVEVTKLKKNEILEEIQRLEKQKEKSEADVILRTGNILVSSETLKNSVAINVTTSTATIPLKNNKTKSNG